MKTREPRTSSAIRQSAVGNRQCLAWHGWRLRVPVEWNPVRLEGDGEKGFVLLADLHGAKLGLRWAAPPKRRRPDDQALVRQALVGEVGTLAADEAVAIEPLAEVVWKSALLYAEPDPPGRDVWTAVSPASGRILQLVYHASRRDRVLADRVLPELREAGADDAESCWSILDLSCRVPAALKLTAHALSAGDLRLSFADEASRRFALVRQIGPAELALARQPLERWAQQHPMLFAGRYRRPGEVVEGGAGGIVLQSTRRPSLRIGRRPPARMTIMAWHDAARDRVAIVEASDAALAERIADSVGWAGSEEETR